MNASEYIMLMSNKENKLLDRRLLAYADIIDNSGLDVAGLRYNYLHGYIAEASFAIGSLYFWGTNKDPNKAVIRLLKEIRNYCMENKLAMAQNHSGGVILFVPY